MDFVDRFERPHRCTVRVLDSLISVTVGPPGIEPCPIFAAPRGLRTIQRRFNTMKQRLFLLLFAAFQLAVIPARADEGMWLLTCSSASTKPKCSRWDSTSPPRTFILASLL